MNRSDLRRGNVCSPIQLKRLPSSWLKHQPGDLPVVMTALGDWRWRLGQPLLRLPNHRNRRPSNPCSAPSVCDGTCSNSCENTCDKQCKHRIPRHFRGQDVASRPLRWPAFLILPCLFRAVPVILRYQSESD